MGILRWSTSVLVYFKRLLDHVIYLKLKKEYQLCKAEQIKKKVKIVVKKVNLLSSSIAFLAAAKKKYI